LRQTLLDGIRPDVEPILLTADALGRMGGGVKILAVGFVWTGLFGFRLQFGRKISDRRAPL
jgi:hypothetical protein